MRSSISFNQLKYIVAVADTGAFGRAAERCAVTQPTLSMQIQRAEELLGVILFDRRTHPVSVTRVGQRVVQQARVVVHEMDKIRNIVRGETEEVSGVVRLAAIPTVAPYLLPCVLPAFTSAYPKVKLVVQELTTGEIINALQRNEIEVGILATPIPDESLLSVPLYEEPFWVYLSPEHSLTKRADIKVKELEREELWLLSEGHCLREQALSVCRKKELLDEHQGVQFESGSLETLIHILDTLPGYTLIPDLLRETLPPEKKKQVRPFQGISPVREISLVAHPTFHRAAVLAALKEVIVSAIPANLQQTGAGEVVPITSV